MKKIVTFFMLFITALSTINAQPTELITKILANGDGGDPGDRFGYAVDICGDYAVIGAPFTDVDGNANEGAAYIHYRNKKINDSWYPIAKLLFNSESADYLGWSVSMTEERVVVGARLADGTTDDVGKVYIYDKPAQGWENMLPTDSVTPINGETFEHFGYSVKLLGDTIVVGAKGKTVNGYDDNGLAYVFVKSAGSWSQVAKLTPTDNESNLHFGNSVSMSPGVIAVGATGYLSSYGKIYVFEKPAGGWNDMNETAGLTITSPIFQDMLGISLDMTQDIIVSGAYQYDYTSEDLDEGAVFLFEKTGNSWTDMNETAKLTLGNPQANDNFLGNSVVIENDFVYAGAAYEDDGANNTGAVYRYDKPSGGWADMTETKRMVLDPLVTDADYGYSLAVCNNVLLIGAKGYNSNEGAAYLYMEPKLEITQDPLSITQGCVGSDISFSIDGNNITSYQWQEKIEGVWTDLSDDAYDSGTQAATFIRTIQAGINIITYYRCIASNSRSEDTSKVATLKMDAHEPIITPRDISVELGSDGTASITPASVVSQISDACPLDTSINISTFDCEDIGDPLTVTITATDVNGYVRTATAEVLVEDKSTPTVTTWPESPQSISANSSCEAELPDYTGDIVADDNCSVGSITQHPNAGTIISGADNLVSLSVRDATGNTRASAIYINVVDDSPPIILSKFSTDYLPANENCQAAIPDYASTVDASDNCDSEVEISQMPEPGTLISGTTTITITATDDDGNTQTGHFVAELDDNISPEFIIDTESQSIGTGESSCNGIIPDYSLLDVATDNCDSDLEISQIPIAGTEISGSTAAITLTATDDGGNSTEITFNAEIIDNTDPEITSPYPNQTLFTDENCEAELPDYTGDVVATDNCDDNLTITQSPEPGSILSGELSSPLKTPPVERGEQPKPWRTYSVSLTVTDDEGNTDEDVFLVYVKDNTPPEVTSTHPDQTIYLNEECTAVIPDYTDDVVAMDNCDANLKITQTPAPGTEFSLSSSQPFKKTKRKDIARNVVLSIEDDATNVTEITFNYSIADNTPPEITSTINDQVLNADENCEAVLPDYTDNIQATDYCDSELEISQIPTPGTTISGISNTITVTATDDWGNADAINFNVEVTDITEPVITCIEDQDIDLESEDTYTVSGDEFDPASVSDNCGGYTLTNNFNDLSTLDGAVFPLGTTTVEWTIIDAGENQASCIFDVTVSNATAKDELAQKGISIYPNPTNGKMYIDFDKNHIEKVVISDLAGKTLIEKTKVLQNETFDLGKYSHGVYIISIHTQGEVLKSKVVKNR